MSKSFKPASGEDGCVITTLRQLKLAVRLYEKGPLRARELGATGSLLGLMERRGIIEPIPTGTVLAPAWRLTAAGWKETLRCRKLHSGRLRSSR